jgi:hypothetical protein
MSKIKGKIELLIGSMVSVITTFLYLSLPGTCICIKKFENDCGKQSGIGGIFNTYS